MVIHKFVCPHIYSIRPKIWVAIRHTTVYKDRYPVGVHQNKFLKYNEYNGVGWRGDLEYGAKNKSL